MRLLVTGGAGYIGSVTAALLLDRGHEVTVFDDLSTGHRDAVPEGAAFVEGDLTDPGRVATVLGTRFDGVLHFAAKALVGESVERPATYYRTNIVGTVELLDAMRAHDVRRIVFSSTAATYGEPDRVPIPEEAPTRPTNPYGRTKLAIDGMLHDYAVAYGLAAVSLRYFNVAGAYGRYRERHDPETHLIPNLLRAVSGQRASVQLFGTDYPTPDGTCIRDYVHVTDLAEAHLLALEAARPGEHRIFNLGNGSGFSNREVIDAVREVTGDPLPVVDSPRRAGDPARLVASSARARSELGWRPSRARLQDMIHDAWAALETADSAR